ncbi:MAG: hypothetical protein AAB860_00925 [Patescibacteria group bacterium]
MAKKKKANNNDSTQSPTDQIQGSTVLQVSRSDILKSLIEAYGKEGTKEKKQKFSELLSKKIHEIINASKIAEKYDVLIIFDETTMLKTDSDRIYNGLSALGKDKKDLLLILVSNGGEPGSAYLIGKLCQAHVSGKKFIVAVPRQAKSAATLLACAADEIHMGSMSELGPIDLQIDGSPALGLKQSIEHIAEIVEKYPDAAEMFSRYLIRSVKPVQIGYYERAAESVRQYAEILLGGRQTATTKEKPKDETAKTLVHKYKDHGFVIDKSEATNIFGADTIKQETGEYLLANEIYIELSEIKRIANILKYTFFFIGTADSEPSLLEYRR